MLDVFDESDALASELLELVDLPLLDDSPKIRISDVACSLSLEHWHSTRALLRTGLLPSALVVRLVAIERNDAAYSGPVKTVAL
jgi:hypothetical protein